MRLLATEEKAVNMRRRLVPWIETEGSRVTYVPTGMAAKSAAH
jgi:hypothetical protein